MAIAVATVRVAIDLLLRSKGYYYGGDPDTFWRLGLSWIWSRHPFFIIGFWTPLQFWISGATFDLLRPFLSGATPIVPVVWNHIFFVGSAVAVYDFTRQIGGRGAATLCLVVVTTMSSDISATYSGVAEPLLVLCGVVFAVLLHQLATSEHQERRVIFLMAGIAMLASAVHYLGWLLVAAFVVLLAIISALKSSGNEGVRFLHWSDLAVALAISLAFPIAWTVANQVRFTDALHYLSQAYAYHGEFATEPLVTRLEAVPAALWNAEPLVVILAVPALIHEAIGHRQRLIFASPALVYLVMLSLVGILGEAVPDLHPRYVLIVFWLVAPLISTSVMETGQSAFPYSMLIPVIVAVGMPTSGVLRSLNFHNWMDPVAREAASAIQYYVDRAAEPLKVYVEPHTCLYPTAGIANSISRPDWVNNFYNPGATPPTSDSESYDLALLVNPLDIRAYAQSHQVVAEGGDYILFAGGQSSATSALSDQLPSNWAPITNEQFLYVSPGGTPFFAFDQASTNRGSAAGIETVEDVQPNGCQIISADVEDWYHANDQPWVVLQQLVVNGVVLWSHDVGASGSCIQQIDNYLMPTTNKLTIQIRAVAIGRPRAPATLQRMSLTGVRNLTLHACDQ